MRKITVIQRLKSIFIDLCLICLFISPFIMVMFILSLMDNIAYQSFIISLFISLFICKDLCKYHSIGKRIFNLYVVENNSGLTPSLIKLIARNIFIIIWPIEIIFCCINPEKRIGDIICGTKVIMMDYQKNDYKNKNLHFYFLVILLLLFVCCYFLIIELKHNTLIKLLFV